MSKSSLRHLRDQIRNCRKCIDLSHSRTQAVPGRGSPSAKMMFIGLAPGRNGADITGIPFTKDKSGHLLREMIKAVGFSSRDIYITNIVKCNPKDHRGRNRAPNRAEIHNCSCYLQKEREIVNPNVLITLGVKATEAVTGRKIGSLRRLNCQVIEIGGERVFPMFHPGFIARGAYCKADYESDFRRLKSLTNI